MGRVETGLQGTGSVRTWCSVPWSAVEAEVGSEGSRCDTHVRRRVGFLSFLLLSLPQLPAVSSPLLFDSGTRS